MRLGTVVCAGPCITEAGAAPAANPSATLVDPRALKIGVELSSLRPSAGVNDGHVHMIVTAQNASTGPVIVQLPPSGDAGPPLSFSYEIVGEGATRESNVRAEVPDVTRFAAFETKRFIFDFQVGATQGRAGLPPGTYEFRGAYGERWAPDAVRAMLAP